MPVAIPPCTWQRYRSDHCEGFGSSAVEMCDVERFERWGAGTPLRMQTSAKHGCTLEMLKLGHLRFIICDQDDAPCLPGFNAAPGSWCRSWQARFRIVLKVLFPEKVLDRWNDLENHHDFLEITAPFGLS